MAMWRDGGAEGALRPRADGLLEADALPVVPIMTPALQGELSASGVLRLERWGVGEIGRVRIEGFRGPFVIAPNRIEGAGGARLAAAQSAPALVLSGAGVRHVNHGPGGRLVVEQRGSDWLIAGGAQPAEAASGLALGAGTAGREADAYVRRCDLLPAAEPLLRSLVIQGAHAAFSSARRHVDGGFAGLSAGLIYANPPRTYYRDGYWTTQLLLRAAPAQAAAEIDLLASRIQPDGEAPSAVILDCERAEAFERRRLEELALSAVHWRAGEWWSDHFDSPLFFTLAVGDYVAVTGDAAMAERHWPRLKAIFERYQQLRGPAGLPLKPANDRDWADNVRRSGLVAYDLGLWVGALDVVARLGVGRDDASAEAARQTAAVARTAISATLWRGRWCADYVPGEGPSEDHLALDGLTLLRYDALPEDLALETLEAVREQLESRRNGAQPYGDFGVLSVFPPFARRADLRAKSAFPYRYHNGADWPWLDGLYAGERLRRGLPGWRYPLMRWWEVALAQGWAGAIEYFSPPFGRGSLLQAWSSLPAAVALTYADRVLAGDSEE
jgi:hypothetical protein